MNQNKVNITRETKISDLFKEYPWLRGDLAKRLKGVNMAKTPLLKVMIPSADIKLLARYAKNMSEDEIIKFICHRIAKFEKHMKEIESNS